MIQRKLPAAVFGTEVKVKGNMDRVLPITGDNNIVFFNVCVCVGTFSWPTKCLQDQ